LRKARVGATYRAPQQIIGDKVGLGKWWRRADPVRAGMAELKVAEVELAKHRAIARIIRSRLERFPARHRKHYSPEERFDILVLMNTFGLTLAKTAEIFLVDSQTIAHWRREAAAEPEKTTVGALVRANPPLRSYDDVVQRLVQMVDSFGIGGSMKIAQMLARAGIKIGRETVRRFRKRKPKSAPTTTPAGPVLRAKYPSHIWLADLTEIRGFLGFLRFKVVVVIDLFSRFPLAFGVFRKEPTCDEMLGVFDAAFRKYGRPRHFVSDQGAQFTAATFKSTLAALGIQQRFGAIGQYGSIAIIERFWRTLKDLLAVKLRPPICTSELNERLELALAYYAVLRPHQGLGGATPWEVLYGKRPAAATAIPPSRVGKRQPPGVGPLPLTVAYLDAQHQLPVLIPSDLAA
jgi:transposase InsO family protein